MGVDGVDYVAVVLAGGQGSRLGGRSKPVLPVGGRPMIARVLAAVDDAVLRVVVGPPGLRGDLDAAVPPGGADAAVPPGGADAAVPPGGADPAVLLRSEQPPGGGPVAALAAGLDAVGSAPGAPMFVAVLAADLPFLTTTAVARLREACSGADGAVYVDASGRRQWLCGVWRAEAVRARLAALAGTGPLAGRSLRELFTPLRVAEVSAPPDGPPPWYDCDTPAELAEARTMGETRDA